MADNRDLFGFSADDAAYPDAPGHRGIDTSIAAAKCIAPMLGNLQRLAKEAIAAAGPVGLTSDELAERLAIDRGSIQPRTSELRARRLIADSGSRRKNAQGRSAIVWVSREYAEISSASK